MDQSSATLVKKEKAILRKITHQTLKQMSEEEKKLKSAEICLKITQFIKSQHPQESLNIASFAANPLEPDLSSLHESLDKHRFFYPICYEDNTLEFFPSTDYSSMLPGKYGILSPDTTNQDAISADSLDIMLIPGYSFTPSGSRLGKGGGYYDRYLAIKNSGNHHSVGICFSNQIIDSIPMNPHDIKVNKIISDTLKLK